MRWNNMDEQNKITIEQLQELLGTNENTKPLLNLIEQIMAIKDEELNDNNIEIVTSMMRGAFTDRVKTLAIESILQSFQESALSRTEAKQSVDDMHSGLDEMIEVLQVSNHKKQILKAIFEEFVGTFDAALEHYLNFNIVLPIKLDENAQVPTYAHVTDAAADLYAAETIVIPAHSQSTMVNTGVHIALPEGWMAMIFPRSSIGSKTGLRLSNSAGIIDSDYRGILGVLYDNISNEDYTINAGDRIAQLMVMPSYRFKPQVVDILPTTERGENGFGSSGK